MKSLSHLVAVVLLPTLGWTAPVRFVDIADAPAAPPAPPVPAVAVAPEVPAHITLHAQASGHSSRGVALSPPSAPRPISANIAPRPPRTLVVSLSPDQKAIPQIDEDLTVMTRLLEKAADVKETGDWKKAMGIPLLTLGGSSPLRAMYLEGFGAIFFIQVKFPLLPPKKEVAAQEEPSDDSEWEEAYNELFGGPRNAGRVARSAAKPQEYDAKVVDELKEDLVESLKHATRIRHLKPQDQVLVVVNTDDLSAYNPHLDHVRVLIAEVAGYKAAQAAAEKAADTLVLRASKSDIDAFAQGKLDLEQFRKKAAVALY